MESDSFYKKQLKLKGWDKDSVRQQHPLIIGLGGIGCAIAIDMCRLGVSSITIIDDDTVKDHSINRQLLYNSEDAHRKKHKVIAAKSELFRQHANETVIYSSRIDAVKSWSVVRDLIDKATVVFQCINYGDYYDAAVSSYCLRKKVPLFMGGTDPLYGHLSSIFFQEYDGKPCFCCAHDLSKKDLLLELHPNKVHEHLDLGFLPRDNAPDNGGAVVYSTGICAQMMVNMFIQYVHKREIPNTVLLNLISMELNKWSVEKKHGCIFCTELEYIQIQKEDYEEIKDENEILM